MHSLIFRVGVSISLLFAVASLNAADAPNATPSPGKKVFDRWCSGCHEPLPGHGFDPPAGTYRLQIRYNGKKPAPLEQRVDLTRDQIRSFVRNGYNMMPRTRKTELTDADLDALVAYLTHKDK